MLCTHRLGFGEATPSAVHIQVACPFQDRFQEKGLHLSSFIGCLLRSITSSLPRILELEQKVVLLLEAGNYSTLSGGCSVADIG